MLIFKLPLPEASVSASLPSNDGSAENRRSTRVIHAVPITIRGIDALGQAFDEHTSTVTVNCNGCKYESKHYVPKGSKLTMEIGGRDRGLPPRKFPARVVWVQRPRTYREIFHIALEFEIPGNVWDIKSPPPDWFPHPDDEELTVPVYAESDEPEPFAVPVSAPLAREADAAGHMQAAAHAVLAVATPAMTPDFAIPQAYLGSLQENQSELDAERQMLRATVETAMTEDMTLLRQRLESHLQEAVQETIKSLADRIAEHVLKAVAEHATERTAAIVAEARETRQANAEELNAKIGLAVREAVSAPQKSPRKSPPTKRPRKSPK
jgi:hypothetical protein